jgi:7,8-dihydropterin-6-yl-methyl-4-(beta-D-ribofuranosyl)aminobenzene 5'-phosphate synthase
VIIPVSCYLTNTRTAFNVILGGMLKAVQIISDEKAAKLGSSSTTGQSQTQEPVIVDIHPDRPQYRGFMMKGKPISFPADPNFAEIRAAGGAVLKSAAAHTLLDNMFFSSGFIESSTEYETGLRGGIRISDLKKGWEKDEEMADERFLMCNVKGMTSSVIRTAQSDLPHRKRNCIVHRL